MISRKALWISSIAILFVSFNVQLAIFGCEIEDIYAETADNCTVLLTSEDFSSIRISSLLPPHQKNCSIIIYKIISTSSSSILKITSSPSVINVNSSSTPSYPNETEVTITETTTPNIFITFQEVSFFKDGTNNSVTMETWNFTDQNYTVEKTYLSRTSYLRVVVKVTGKWTEEAVELSFKEIEFCVFNMTSSKKKSRVTLDVFGDLVKYRNYRPNSVYIYQIQKSRDMNVSSVSMTLEYLDLDAGVGEYLLIGSGDTPFQGPPPLFISSVSTQSKQYQINDENAYIVFVATSTRRRRHGFKIRWEHKGTKIVVKDDDSEPSEDDILQSIQVCIYNHSAALEEFKKPKEEQFVNFRKVLSVIGSEVAMNNTLPEISSSQISFYRISAIEDNNKFYPEGLLYVMLKVEGSEKGKAALSRTLLQRSFDLYHSSQEVNQYLIGSCPKRKPMSPAFYALLPIFCCFLMIIWIWKQKPFSEYLMRRKRGKELAPRDRMSRAEENHFYAMTQMNHTPSHAPMSNTSSSPIPNVPPSPIPSPRPRRVPEVRVTRCSVQDDDRRQTSISNVAGTDFLNDPESGHTQTKSMMELSSRPARNGHITAVENPAFNSYGEDFSSDGKSTQDMVTRC